MWSRNSPLSASIFDGVARFDGFELLADPITDPRRDRVLPVMEEEQIFMCRQMDRRLRAVPRGALALDVGTGCGVFAIWAAAKGCRVVAIDVSSRALTMARENAGRNNIPVVRDLQALRPGTICLKKLKFGPRFTSTKRFAAAFDFVFLNPPYNPTCPGVRVAIHAESGEDAQRAFREQIVLAPRVLKRGGWCIGNQMTVGDQDDWDALRWVRRAFGRLGQVGWCDILDLPATATGPFLHQQYAAYLQRRDGRRPTPAQVSAYIDRISNRWSSFGLIYYEINHLGAYSTHKLRRSFRPVATWSDRAILHREIVERSPSAPVEPGAHT